MLSLLSFPLSTALRRVRLVAVLTLQRRLWVAPGLLGSLVFSICETEHSKSQLAQADLTPVRRATLDARERAGIGQEPGQEGCPLLGSTSRRSWFA